MPEYDAENFDPPAPVAYVILRNPATGVSLDNLRIVLDGIRGKWDEQK